MPPAPHPLHHVANWGEAIPINGEEVSLVGFRKVLWLVLGWEGGGPSRQRVGVLGDRSSLLQVLHC